MYRIKLNGNMEIYQNSVVVELWILFGTLLLTFLSSGHITFIKSSYQNNKRVIQLFSILKYIIYLHIFSFISIFAQLF